MSGFNPGGSDVLAARRRFVASGVAVGYVLVLGSWLLPGAAQSVAAGAGVVVLAATWVRSRMSRKAVTS